MTVRASIVHGLNWFFCGPPLIVMPEHDPLEDDLYVPPVVPRIEPHRAAPEYHARRVPERPMM